VNDDVAAFMTNTLRDLNERLRELVEEIRRLRESLEGDVAQR
jgi:hypothetical protein